MAGFKIDKGGFTLMEMMLVVAILAMIATLSVPSIHRARISANEQSAIGALKTLHTAIETYREVYNNAYPVNLSVLANDAMPFIPRVLVTGCNNASAPSYHGYQLCYDLIPATSIYTCNATPLIMNTTGVRIFQVTKSGVIEELRGANWTALE